MAIKHTVIRTEASAKRSNPNNVRPILRASDKDLAARYLVSNNCRVNLSWGATIQIESMKQARS